ncbi:hypothetical protein BJ912DRAFT_937591 [Pholiota molesta]|nr:hypothetical protein BJ912DRAFT_937591 [Pholiota molesta]
MANVEKDVKCPPSKNAPVPVPPPSSRSWRWKLLAAAVFLSVVAYQLPTQSGRDPSATYALCSQDGNHIYTVDESNTSVECIVVQGSRIVDSGNLDSIQERAESTTGLSSIAVRYAPKGSVIIPGISGTTYSPTLRVLLTSFVDCRLHRLSLPYPRIRSESPDPLSEGKTMKGKFSHFSGRAPNSLSHRRVIRTRLHQGQPDLERNTTSVIEGWGWDHASWDVTKMPSSEDLEADEVIAGRPSSPEPRRTRIWVSKRTLEANAPYPDTVEGVLSCATRPVIQRVRFNFRFFSLVLFELIFIPIFCILGVFMDNKQTKDLFRDTLAGAADKRLSARSVKIFADGALRTGGAADLSGGPERGHPRFLKDGWQVNVHAIGDRANAITTFGACTNPHEVGYGASWSTWSHASIQPTHAISDMGFAEDRLYLLTGAERVKGLYALEHTRQRIYAAITRLSTEGTSPHGPGGWFPDQRLTRLEALRGMTIDPAYASFTEDTLGSLVPGKRADYVVLSQDIMSVGADKIMDTRSWRRRWMVGLCSVTVDLM